MVLGERTTSSIKMTLNYLDVSRPSRESEVITMSLAYNNLDMGITAEHVLEPPNLCN